MLISDIFISQIAERGGCHCRQGQHMLVFRNFSRTLRFGKVAGIAPEECQRCPRGLTCLSRLQAEAGRPRPNDRLSCAGRFRKAQHCPEAWTVVRYSQGNAMMFCNRRHEAQAEAVATRTPAFVEPEKSTKDLLPRPFRPAG